MPFRNTVEPREYGRHQRANDLAVLTGDRINEGFFYKKVCGRFAGRPKQVAAGAHQILIGSWWR